MKDSKRLNPTFDDLLEGLEQARSHLPKTAQYEQINELDAIRCIEDVCRRRMHRAEATTIKVGQSQSVGVMASVPQSVATLQNGETAGFSEP